jgi:hypothetical protein
LSPSLNVQMGPNKGASVQTYIFKWLLNCNRFVYVCISTFYQRTALRKDDVSGLFCDPSVFPVYCDYSRAIFSDRVECWNALPFVFLCCTVNCSLNLKKVDVPTESARFNKSRLKMNLSAAIFACKFYVKKFFFVVIKI